jgi:nucleoid DNA-binding protein
MTSHGTTRPTGHKKVKKGSNSQSALRSTVILRCPSFDRVREGLEEFGTLGEILDHQVHRKFTVLVKMNFLRGVRRGKNNLRCNVKMKVLVVVRPIAVPILPNNDDDEDYYRAQRRLPRIAITSANASHFLSSRVLRILKSAISYDSPCKITFDPIKLLFHIEFNLINTCTEVDEYIRSCFETAADTWMEGNITFPLTNNVRTNGLHELHELHELHLELVSYFVEDKSVKKKDACCLVESATHRKSIVETLDFCKTLIDAPTLVNATLLIDPKSKRVTIKNAPSTTSTASILLDGFTLKRSTAWTAWTAATRTKRDDEDDSSFCNSISSGLDANLTTTTRVIQAFSATVSDRMMQGKNVLIRNFAQFHGKKRGDGTYKPNCIISDTFGQEDPQPPREISNEIAQSTKQPNELVHNIIKATLKHVTTQVQRSNEKIRIPNFAFAFVMKRTETHAHKRGNVVYGTVQVLYIPRACPVNARRPSRP